MKYKVMTSYLSFPGYEIHDDSWIFDTREEAQKFVDKFYEAFPKDGDLSLHDPYLIAGASKPEIEEIDDASPDPYAWLDKRIKEKEKRKK